MKPTPLFECAVPADSRIATTVVDADFADCYCWPDPQPDAPALQAALDLLSASPAWMNRLLRLRNRVVGLVGLKHLGDFSQLSKTKTLADYRVGDRVTIFRIASLSPDEAVLFDDDKHLRVELSLCKRQVAGRSVLMLSTVVHNHNRLGRAYMAVVGPAHRLLVPRVLRHSAGVWAGA